MSMPMTPEERAIYFQDPGHGKVGDICLSLGFGDASKVGSSSRTYLAISQKTIEFRKNFVKRRGLTAFPIDFEDPAVKSCVHEFLTANEQLFDSSEETRDASWLSLPDDKAQILTILCKLMVTQEGMYRKNDEYLKRKKKQVIQQDSESELENDEVDESTIRVQPKQAQAKKPEASNETDTTGTKRSIERHLEYTYPVNEVYETVPPDWLFDPRQPWPNSEETFAFRYFHERNLYAVTKSTRSSLKRFALALTKRLNLELETHRTIIVRQRCKQLIKVISTSWGENGTAFLVKTPSGLVKSSQFENAWKFHRNSWLYKVHGGITDGVIELNQAYPPTIKEESSSKKRLHTIPPTPESSELSPVVDSEPSLKRPRHDVGINRRMLMGWQNTTEHRLLPALLEKERNDVATVATPAPPLPPPVLDKNTAPVVNQPVARFSPIPYEPTPAPKAPAFTPVNVLRSNVPAAGLQYHTSHLPRTRPPERSSNSANLVPQQQPRHARESMPAGSNVTYDLLNLSPSRLTRSKSTGTFAEPPNPGNPEPVISTVENSLSSTASSVANSIIMNAAPNTTPNSVPNLAPSPAPRNASPWAQSHQQTDPQDIASQNTTPQAAILKLSMPTVALNTLPIGSPNSTQSPAPPHSNPAPETTPKPTPEVRPSTPTQEPPFQEPPSQQPRIQDSSRRTLTPASINTSPIDTKPSSNPTTFVKPPISLSTPRHTETPEPSNLNSTPLSHQRLSFILENQKRSPDHDHPLSASTFRSLSHTEFFDLFCERSGRERERCEYLIFKYNWGYRDSFVVKEHGNEVEWEEIKERVRDTFFMARDRAGMRVRNGNGNGTGANVGGGGSMNLKGRWQVWVMGPEDEDEEW